EYNKLQNPWVQIGLIIIFVALVISTIAIAISVYPRDGKHDPENVIYFVDYTTSFGSSQEYKDRIILKTKAGSLTDAYAKEVYCFGQMLKKEYRWQKFAFAVLSLFFLGGVLVSKAFL